MKNAAVKDRYIHINNTTPIKINKLLLGIYAFLFPMSSLYTFLWFETVPI